MKLRKWKTDDARARIPLFILLCVCGRNQRQHFVSNPSSGLKSSLNFQSERLSVDFPSFFFVLLDSLLFFVLCMSCPFWNFNLWLILCRVLTNSLIQNFSLFIINNKLVLFIFLFFFFSFAFFRIKIKVCNNKKELNGKRRTNTWNDFHRTMNADAFSKWKKIFRYNVFPFFSHFNQAPWLHAYTHIQMKMNSWMEDTRKMCRKVQMNRRCLSDENGKR